MGWLLLALLYLLVAPPLFLLAPLAGLLAVSRPASLREWVWLSLLVAVLAGMLATPGKLGDQFVYAAGILVGGAFTATALAGERQTLSRGSIAVAAAGLALALWCAVFGISWTEIQDSATRQLAAGYTALARRSAAAGNPAGEQAAAMFRSLADQAAAIARLLPAGLALMALLGCTLAWRGYRLVARRPLGPAPRRFAEFTFSDHAVWAVVLGLTLVLAPVPPAAEAVGANLLVVALALYAVRGAAVVRAGATLSVAVTAAVVIAALLLFAFVAGGLMLLGLADTWVDFRRRLAASSTGGS